MTTGADRGSRCRAGIGTSLLRRRTQNLPQPVNSFLCKVEHFRVCPQELRASPYRDVMRCLFCKNKLPDGLRPAARYCGTNCRSAAYRARQREMPRASHDRVTASRLVREPGRRHADSGDFERLLAAASDRIITALTRDRAGHTYRVGMDTQVLSQAPAGAAGYLLVLPAERASVRPRLVPHRGINQLGWYSLSPFQAPDDLRLRDGCWYRIVWVDVTGRRLPSSGGATIPGLYYFVGPPDSVIPVAAACDDATRSVVRESNAQAHQSGAKAAQPEPGLTELLAPQPSVIEPAAEQPVPPSDLTSSDHAKEATDVQAQPSFQPDEAVNRFSSEPSRLAIDAAPEPSDPVAVLSADEIKLLCGILYDVEESAQLQYEGFRLDAEKRGAPPPMEPRTLLGGEKRKELKRVAADERLFWAYISLAEKYMVALQHAEEAILPPPFQSLGQKTRDRAKEILGTGEHQRYALALLRRAHCLILGQPLPPEPETGLPTASRQALKKLLQDRRTIAYLGHLMQKASQTSESTSSPSRHTEA